MGYNKLAKGVSEKDIKKKIEQVMPSKLENRKEFQAKSQRIFIGSHQHPKVNVGTLSPTQPVNPQLMDNPEKWYKENFSIERIASLRTSLINSKKKQDVKNPEKMVEKKKEIAITKKPADIEIKLDKKPFKQVNSGRVKPTSTSADLKQLKLGENPSVNKKIEKIWYDTDVKTNIAMTELQQKGVDNYKMQQAFTAGILGRKEDRKLVPTRWSITATDDILSKNLRKNVKQNQELGETHYFKNSYLGNNFHIFLIPGKFEYELIELKRPKSTWNKRRQTYIAQNYENYNGRTSYADETAGAYYASRLGALETLNKINRQGKILIVRDVTPDYWAPLGVWIIRETVRNSFEDKKKPDKQPENIKQIKEVLSKEFTILYPRILKNSKLLESTQESLTNYF